MSDGNSKLQIRLEKHESSVNAVENEHADSLIPQAVRDFVLPAGFPESVTVDYLEYMLLQFPTNVTGWICHVLVTSSLLKAVGVGSFTGTSAAASAAAIRWVSKDGIGAFGRLLIECTVQEDLWMAILGGRFGTLFDDDPKKWRMYADFIGSAGSIFELITPLYPGYFLPLASLGNLAKAVARGFKDPSFRVIQNHFAESGNLGEVAAKILQEYFCKENFFLRSNDVFSGGSMGSRSPAVRPFNRSTYNGYIRCKVIILNSYSNMAEYSSPTSLVALSVPISSQVPHSYVVCNEEENILTWERFLHPQISFGVPMERMLGGEESSDMVNRLLKLYKNEKYVLFVEQFGSREPKFLVVFKESATSISVLRSLWQAHWLQKDLQNQDDIFSWLEDSILALEHGFTDFLEQMERAGWDQNQIILKVPKEPVLVSEYLNQDV
ncbi:protein root UVB sensitive 5 isoform X1 [Panicum miliaceum]|uniref:Protein root UVB sensitive 5 isoform X1 n=1 Tax=Panicum miliaceum TaxID=4540 RepID=A0A3L6SU06_PANMI|nr:protein root UVB sensitive 5 isoform X1 [Panicum miliaceum]